MSEQRQHGMRQEASRADKDGPDAENGAARLAATRTQLGAIYAAAESILAGIRVGNSERFLEQVQQSGGE
jgi:hypothetical protein